MNLLKNFAFVAAVAILGTVDASAEEAFCTSSDCYLSFFDYQNVMTNFEELYPSVDFHAHWTEDRPQAFASFMKVSVSGGFARKPDLNLGGLINVVCHEVGHALYSLTEGEADYFSTSICMKDYFKRFTEDLDRLSQDASPQVAHVCSSVQIFGFGGDCLAVLMSAQNAAQVDSNRCYRRLKDLRDVVEDSPLKSIFVEERQFRCLRSVSSVSRQDFSSGELIDVIDQALVLLDGKINHFVEDERRVSDSYTKHNSPTCRMQTLRAGYFREGHPSCWAK